MIIFFRTKILAQQLYTNTVPEFHKLLYLVLPFITSLLIDILFKQLNYESDPQSSTYRALVIYTIGMLIMWFINHSGDGMNFLDRYICLSFPATIKINIIGFMYGLFAEPIYFKIGLEPIDQALIREIFFTLNAILFYILVGYWINAVSKNKFHFIR